MTLDFAQDWPAPAAPRPIVLIGAGGIAGDAHLPAYAKAGLPVAGLTDIDGDRARETAARWAVAKVYPDVAAAVADHGTAAVYDVAVPPEAITGILEDLPDGAAVLIQKPMGRTIDEARAIRALCRDKRLTAAINFQLRFSPMFMAAHQAIAAGVIGDLLEIEVHLNIHTPWHLFPFLRGMDRVEMSVHSIHYLDTIRALAGNPAGVFVRTLPDPRAEGLAQTRTSAILDYGERLRCLMSINHNHACGRKFQSAWFRLEGTGGAMMVKLGVLFDYPNGEADELWLCRRGGAWEQVPLSGSWFIEAFMGPMRNLQRVAAGEDEALFSGVEDAFHSMALLEACYRAADLPGEAPAAD